MTVAAALAGRGERSVALCAPPPAGCAGSPDGALVAGDGHVHFHAGWAAGPFLDTAADNLEAACAAAGGRADLAALLLADTALHDGYERLRRAVAGGGAAGWRLAATDEAGSFLARRPGAPPLAVIAGRQIRTAEGLEVLALACRRPFPDGMGVVACCAAVRAAGGLVVLPWSLGKWWGGRGRLLARLLAGEAGGRLLLGDTALRPRLGPWLPRAFGIASGRGIAILPGSDPLSLPAELLRVGSCGFTIRGSLDTLRPAASLRHLLGGADAAPRPLGSHLGTGGALLRQLALRVAAPARQPA